MLTPKQMQEIADTLLPMIDDLNTWITQDMIRRMLARIGRGEAPMMTASDEWQAQVLQEAGGLLEDVQAEIQRFLPLSDAEIARIFEDAAIKSLDADNRVYTQAGARKLALSRRMMDLVEDAYRRTNGTLRNLTRTTAESSQKKFLRVLDAAHMKVMTGAQSYTGAVRDAVMELAETQTQVVYPSGHVDSIETAVLRAVRTGTAQASGNLSIQGMEENGWDLIRVSSHLGARYGDGGQNPGNHFWWQGKLYTRTGKYPEYPPFVETTGYGTGEGLCGWNCRHSFGPGSEVFNPFKDYDADENKKAYDLSQQQRKMERRIRHSKGKLIGLKTAIDATEDPAARAKLEEEYTRTAQKLKSQNEAYNQFCEDNGLKRYEDRLQVAKWNREQARKAIQAEKDRAKAIENVQSSIRNGEYPLLINVDKQQRHMLEYSKPGRSVVTISLSELQDIVTQKAGTGELKFNKGTNDWSKKETIDAGREIGYTLNREGLKVYTSRLKLHYSKTGIHAVPYSGGGKHEYS